MYYRIEQKYICNAKDFVILQSRLQQLLQRDQNTTTQAPYKVKSVYFDDDHNTGFWENEDGIAKRRKYRIRTYDDSDALIRLEIKEKAYQYIHKTTCMLNKEQARCAIQGKGLPFLEHMPPAYAQMYLKNRLDRLKPVVIVEYHRDAYVCEQGNVRITLDQDISASVHTNTFFEKSVAKRLLLPSGQFVLEVKYDEFLPTHIYNALNLHQMQQTACSKYYLSRLALKQTFMHAHKPYHQPTIL